MNIPNPFIIMAHFDLVGLSSEDKPLTVKDGSTYFEVDTSNLYIFYKGTWYLQGEQEEQAEQEVQANTRTNNIPILEPQINIPKDLKENKELQEIEESEEVQEIEESEEVQEIEEPEEVQEIEELEEGEE